MKPVRAMGGGEKMVKDEPKFKRGDIIHKEKHRDTLIYFIVGVEKRKGRVKYRYFLYSGEVFEKHQNSGWHDVDYFDKLVENEDLGNKTDYHVGQFYPQGHISDYNNMKSIGNEHFYTLSLDKMKNLQNQGSRVIRDAWLFYETTGQKKAIAVHNVGWESEGLADDMLRMSYINQNGKWVDHEKRVMEAINRGLWIPIELTDSKINESKTTRL